MLPRRWLRESAIGVFPNGNSTELIQLLAYDLTTSDLIRKVKVTAIFKQHTDLINSNVVYSVDISGFTPQAHQKNYIVLTLNHDLDLTKRARIYLLTKRNILPGDEAQLTEIVGSN